MRGVGFTWSQARREWIGDYSEDAEAAAQAIAAGGAAENPRTHPVHRYLSALEEMPRPNHDKPIATTLAEVIVLKLDCGKPAGQPSRLQNPLSRSLSDLIRNILILLMRTHFDQTRNVR